MATLRAVAREVDPRLAIEGLSTMGDVVGGLIGRQRFYAFVVSSFGAMIDPKALTWMNRGGDQAVDDQIVQTPPACPVEVGSLVNQILETAELTGDQIVTGI